MTLVRMLAFRPQAAGAQAAPPPVIAPGRAADASRVPVPAPSPSAPVPAPAAARPPAPSASIDSLTPASWPGLSQQLELMGLARQLASNCAYLGRQGALLRFALDPKHQAIRSRSQEDKLAQALSRHFGETLKIEVEVAAAPAAETPRAAPWPAIRPCWPCRSVSARPCTRIPCA
jgi:DNA polymerase-3 subunit gamma/tau